MTATQPPSAFSLHPFSPSPSDRDIEIYETVHLAGVSLRSAASQFQLSVTRIRQIVKRVVEWLADHLPPEIEVAREKQVQLAKNLAADRLNYAYGELIDRWRETQDTSFLLKTSRFSLALARLGVIPGTLDGLFADACEATEANSQISDSDNSQSDDTVALFPAPHSEFHAPSPPPEGHCVPCQEADIVSAGSRLSALAATFNLTKHLEPVNLLAQSHDPLLATDLRASVPVPAGVD